MADRLFDWSAAYDLLPVEYAECGDTAALRAGGAEFTFHGDILAINGEAAAGRRAGAGGAGLLTLTGSFRPAEPAVVHTVEWFHGRMRGYDETLIHSTKLQDTAVFFRKGDVSLFLSLDFPCSRIDGCCISYEPHIAVAGGEAYTPESVTVGAVRLSGAKAGRFDRAEIEGMCAYIESRYPNRFDRPVISASCITNRMTDVRDGRVFYSMWDNPTLYLAPGVLREEVELCAELGIEYYQLFEDQYNWPDEETCGGSLREIAALGRRLGVRVGDYVHPGELYCPHYNYGRRAMDKPQWRQQNRDGSLGQFCFGCDEFADFIISDVVGHNRRYGEELIDLDMLCVQPCYNPTHNHGEGGLYRQVKGICRLMAALADLSENYLVWTNSGNWLEFMPKLLWYNPNVYLTDPHFREYTPTLNMLKYLDDCRREQMITVHNGWFVPYRYYTNCEYYHAGHGRVHDMRFFEYGLLQGLAVTPNICFGELRTFLNRIPHDQYAYCMAFIRKWLGFLRENYAMLSRTWQAGQAPGTGASEIYAHVSGDGGFLFFVNQDAWEKRMEIRLDRSIGLSAPGRYRLQELYPDECACAEGGIPFSEYADEVRFDIPAYAVRIIQIRPYEKADGLEVFGMPAEVRRAPGGYEIALRAPQGCRKTIGFAFPEGERLESCVAEPVRTVELYTFPAACRTLRSAGGTAKVEVSFPRDRADGELSRWRVNGGTPVHLPASGSPFLGAYIHNLFSEDLGVTLRLAVSGRGTDIRAAAPDDDAAGAEALATAGPADFAGRTTYAAALCLPFIEWPALTPEYGRDEVMELCFRDPGRVRSVACAIGGKPVEVHKYRYPYNLDTISYYIELMGAAASGEETEIELLVEWND